MAGRVPRFLQVPVAGDAMQLGLLLALILTITICEHAPHTPVAHGPRMLGFGLLAMALLVAVATLASVGTARSLRRQPAQSARWLARYGRWQRIHFLLWLAESTIVMSSLHWPQLVCHNWGLEQVFVLRDLLLFAPVWLPLLLSWVPFYEVELAVRNLGESAAGTQAETAPAGRIGYVWLQARQHLGLCLLPLLALLLVEDLANWLVPRWAEAESAWLVYVLPLAMLMLFFPQLLSRIWPTHPLPAGPLRNRLERLASDMRVRCREYRVWHTDSRLLNAAVTGLLPPLRYVLLTDALLDRLDHEQVEAIVAHELGHVRRRHLVLRLLLLSWPVWLAANLQVFRPDLLTRLVPSMAPPAVTAAGIGTVAVPLVLLVYLVVALGWYSHLLEYDADLCVHEVGRTGPFLAALAHLAQLSGESHRRRTWLHPSMAHRGQRLIQASDQPGSLARYRRRLNGLHACLVFAWLAAPLLALTA